MSALHPDLTKEQAEEAFAAKSFADRFDEAEVIEKAQYPTSPISIRLSTPLLKKIDRIAAADGRTRSNLIQRILWSHVRAHEAEAKSH